MWHAPCANKLFVLVTEAKEQHSKTQINNKKKNLRHIKKKKHQIALGLRANHFLFRVLYAKIVFRFFLSLLSKCYDLYIALPRLSSRPLGCYLCLCPAHKAPQCGKPRNTFV